MKRRVEVEHAANGRLVLVLETRRRELHAGTAMRKCRVSHKAKSQQWSQDPHRQPPTWYGRVSAPQQTQRLCQTARRQSGAPVMSGEIATHLYRIFDSI